MKIFISCLVFDDGKSGISDYITSVVREMLLENEVYLLIHPSDAAIFPIKTSNIHFMYVSEWLKRPIISMFWHLYLLPFWYNLKSYDLVFLPAGNRRLLAFYPSNTVVTFHDLSQFYISNKYDSFRMFYIKKIIPHYLKKAPHIYAISENTKRDIVRFYSIPAEKISVNYNGYDKHKLIDTIDFDIVKSKFNLSKKYMLYIARIEHPGKNHIGLLQAYDLLPSEISDEYELICAGGMWNGSEIVIKYVQQMKHPQNIHFPGFITNQEMSSLYKNASLYVFPSLYEGFGIPILEAFASGIPVICSNRSSLPEIGGDAVLTFDPLDAVSLMECMRKVLSDNKLQSQMIQLGHERLKLFSWTLHAQKIINSTQKLSPNNV